MKFDIEQLYGIYEMTNLEAYENDQRTNERHNSGIFVFTRDHRLSVVSGSNEWVMAYCGSFEVKDDSLIINVEACNVREREGGIITRKIHTLDGTWLTLGYTKPNIPGSHTEITWKKKVSL